MYSQTQTPFDDSSKGSGAPKGITGVLLGLVFCYQLGKNLFMNTALNHADSELAGELDGACAAVPGAAGPSSLCMEAQLFQGWRELPAESQEELDGLLAISPIKQQSVTAPATTSAAPIAPKPKASNLRAGSVDPSALLHQPQKLEEMLWDLAFSVGGGDTTHEAPEKHHKPAPKAATRMRGAAKLQEQKIKQAPKKPFAKDLSDLQEKLEAKMQSQARRHAEHRALRALHETAHTASVQASEEGMTVWAHNIDDLTHEMQDHMKKRRRARAEHEAAHASHPTPLEKQAEPEAHPLLDEVQSLGYQLCKDPERRNRPSCAQFLHLHEQSDVHHKDRHESAHDRQVDAMAHIKLLEKHLAELHTEQAHDSEEIQKESTQFLRDLCADPSRSSYPACAQLLATSRPAEAVGSTPPAVPAPAKGLRAGASHPHEVRHLHWTSMKGRTNVHGHAGSSAQLLLDRKELRGAHWDGNFPKVACITVLPQGHTTETLMRYFMDNYKLQHYEGERQLVLVYHSADREASRVAHLYADGTTIIASPARGLGEFPSATAWRYGAWLAHDSELVARWDFDAFHHPNRLSMQVRALASAGRPASLVPRITSFDEDGKSSTVSGGAGPHGSMIGDAAWMQKHWMPLLEEERSVVRGIQASNIVQVDMPELLAYHDVPVSSK